MKVTGEEGAREASAFVAPEAYNGKAGSPRSFAVGALPFNIARPVPARVIDLRWWLCALAIGGALWTAMLSV